ncbi:uncharacterized protein KD926_002349 [Aspergillus affinis]|uniref:uncharacterized protein n=1 Tax=Aspergillus affinis TaxID=1070780 RepID=UPI0022FF2C4B|nr:uncharacterized protein KD926_002349 [Aspergillus affinis]KAI9043970.1 hypothetical protein KD926_002349 [Aspergillus affinis]
MAFSQPDSPSDFEPDAIPESPPTIPSHQNTILSLYDAPSSLPDAIPESSPPISSLYTFPLPPLDQQYDTPEQGITAINAFARPHSYAVSILRSKRTKKGVMKTVRLCCDRGRAYRDRTAGNKRQRQSNTLAIECQFSISLRLQKSNTWRLTVENSTYNYETSPVSTHVAHRIAEVSNKAEDIRKQLDQGLLTRHILTAFRKEDRDSSITAQDIYNLRRKFYTEFLAGRTPL